MARIDGYDVTYTHRGRWKAYRRYRGDIVDAIPIAWDLDWTAGKPPSLLVGFETIDEALERLKAGEHFDVALAKKPPRESGRKHIASSKDIYGLFKVRPMEIVPVPHRSLPKLRCDVIERCPPAQDALMPRGPKGQKRPAGMVPSRSETQT
jgi:hypothetical protein